MKPKLDIEQLRVLHDLKSKFAISNELKQSLENQLPSEATSTMERFFRGYEMESWFESIFSAMPWTVLIHALDQRQLPSRSKTQYQVPDFMLLVETTRMSHQALFVEVKRVAKEKQSLKIQSTQMDICESYAKASGIPLIYAIYWENFKGWTLNTPDTFERKGSSCRLAVTSAFQYDCSLIVGDICYLIPANLRRRTRFDQGTVSASDIADKKYGRVVSDFLVLNGMDFELSKLESAAIDAMIPMRTISVTSQPDNIREILQESKSNSVPRLSSWITRHLSLFQIAPTEETAWVSAYTIGSLGQRLQLQEIKLFPSGRSPEVARLELLFFRKQPPGSQPGKVAPVVL